jgi:hypothetical protein
MNTALILSSALGIVGVTGQVIAARNPIAGWTISIAAQPLWFAFYITVGGWPLLILSTGYLYAAIVNLRTALRARGLTFLTYPVLLATQAAAVLRRARLAPPAFHTDGPVQRRTRPGRKSAAT